MKRFYLILIGLLMIVLFVSCNSGQNIDNSDLFADKQLEEVTKDVVKKSVVFRVNYFSKGETHRNYGAFLLENGDKLLLRQNHLKLDDWLFLEKGDTVVYHKEILIDICWRK